MWFFKILPFFKFLAELLPAIGGKFLALFKSLAGLLLGMGGKLLALFKSLAGLLLGMGGKLLALFKSLAGLLLVMGGKLLGLFVKLVVLIGIWLSSKDYVDVATNIALQFVPKDIQVQKATIEMSNSLGEALWIDHFAVKVVFISCIILLVVFIATPLIYKALTRRRLEIFISFEHTKEKISENLQKYFESEGARVSRIPFQKSATHQNIVMRASAGINRCDSFVCLPGYIPSYVEHEVLAATTSKKPVIFLISENSGTLPNTADKRYPMFRLETTIQKGLKPLIDFLSYIGADLKSTWKLCWQALSKPFMYISRVALILEGICFISLWVYCFIIATISSHNLTKGVSVSAEFERTVVLAHVAVLIFGVSIAFFCFSYVTLFLLNLVKQFQASKKARLKTVAAQFDRDDWVGVIPGLSPGETMYECLFETAPSAHHEIEGKQEMSPYQVLHPGSNVFSRYWKLDEARPNDSRKA